MPDTTEPPHRSDLAPLRVRLAWFVGIALASALVVGGATEVLHLLIVPRH